MVNVKPVQLGKNTRMSFSKIEEVLKMPNLIEIQKNSYEWFLNEGLKEVFQDVSGITDFNNNLVLDFVDYKLDDKPNYSVPECKGERRHLRRRAPGSRPACSTRRPGRSRSPRCSWATSP